MPYIPSPDWSKNRYVPETPLAHEASKFLGAAGIETALGYGIAKIVKFLKPVVTKVDDAAGAATSVFHKGELLNGRVSTHRRYPLD